MSRAPWVVFALVASLLSVAQAQQSRLEKVLGDRKKVTDEGFWIYNDLPGAFAKAKESKKPLMVVLRCIPCEECVKLDDDIIEQNAEIKPLLDKFVCARQVSTNGLDLSTFQFDTDQSFAVFFLNPDGTIYGRFGTRSHRKEWKDDVSVEGLAKAMQGALALHEKYPQNQAALAGKRGPEPLVASPEQFTVLKPKYKGQLEFGDTVVQSCIHCHQIGDALREEFRRKNEPLPQHVLFPYPHPKSVGLILDPKQRATVLRVEPDSPAAAAGFKPGDEVRQFNKQPLISIADVQWVLHQASPEGATLQATVARNGKEQPLALKLPAGWRQRDDISWRSSSWGLRRMGTGGLLLETLADDDRAKQGIKQGEMALLVKHVGQYGPHAAARDAGFRQGDILVAFDGRSDLLRESDVLAHSVTQHKPGDKVQATVLREGKRIDFTLPMQP